MSVLVNGQSEQTISIFDRGFNYGDGVFTTVLIKQQQPLHFEYHLQRLKDGCEKLGLFEPEWQKLKRDAQHLAEQADFSLAVLKIVLTRGQGGRGYSPLGTTKSSTVMSLHSYPQDYLSAQQGLEVGIANFRIGLSPSLAGLKHLNRLENVLLKKELDERGLVDAIVLDIENKLVCSSAGNLFWRKQQRWFTPSLELAGVAGTTRKLVIEYFKKNNIDCLAVRAEPEELLSANAAFICNSLMGIVPLKKISEHAFQIDQLEHIRQALQLNLSAC